jgi:hypothetical protein
VACDEAHGLKQTSLFYPQITQIKEIIFDLATFISISVKPDKS